MTRRWLAFAFVVSTVVAAICTTGANAAGPRVLAAGTAPQDRRLGDLIDLNGYFPLTPPATREEWAARSDYVRRQLLVGLGLWPMPTKTPAHAVVHTPIDKGEYTVEHVYLQSFPGHYVSGNLYRPKGKSGKLPGVLCPHGHWANGRFFDHGDAIEQQLAEGGEKFPDSGRSPLQARCVQLARMGCVVFFYDMVGYADSQQISQAIAHGFREKRPHMEGPDTWGFFSTPAELRLQNIMGLQTYNSIRVLDWFSELPDVDAKRIGVTGASGGGTQTFILGAIDPRPAVAFPAVMVSTAMQGGCTCENCDYLRVETGNIELAGLFAPKPLGMSGANDWTVEIQTKGLPELKSLYKLLGAPDNVHAVSLNRFGHNYNYPSRAVMYAWMNKHLGLGFDTVPEERDYERLSPEQLGVYNAEHPRPKGGEDHERELLAWIAKDSDAQIAALSPKGNHRTAARKFNEVVGGAFDSTIGRRVLPAGAVEFDKRDEVDRGSYIEFSGLLNHAAAGEQLPALFLLPKQWNKDVVIWVSPEGKAGLYGSDGALKAEVKSLVDGGAAVAGVDLLYQGEFLVDGKPLASARRVKGDREFAGFTYGYNRTLFAQRVRDVLTVVSFAKHHDEKPNRIMLMGEKGAGHWVAAAAAQAGSAVQKTAVDTGGFRFASLKSFDDTDFLPGAVKYGDLPALLALSAFSGQQLFVTGEDKRPDLLANAPGSTVVTGAGPDGVRAAADWLIGK